VTGKCSDVEKQRRRDIADDKHAMLLLTLVERRRRQRCRNGSSCFIEEEEEDDIPIAAAFVAHGLNIEWNYIRRQDVGTEGRVKKDFNTKK
jgi:hypothetical protein